MYKKKIINDPELNFPCVIQHCEFTKTQYEKYDLVCKNKKKVEIDFVVVDKDRNVFIFEISTSCSLLPCLDFLTCLGLLCLLCLLLSIHNIYNIICP